MNLDEVKLDDVEDNGIYTVEPRPNQRSHWGAKARLQPHDPGKDQQAGFESVDMIAWNNKCYREQLLLCDGNGEILKWRKYFSQFYVSTDVYEGLKL